MANKRQPLFQGDVIEEKRGRGRPVDACASDKTRAGLAVQQEAVRRILLRMLTGQGRDAAIEEVAPEMGRSVRTLQELYVANVRDALPEVLAEIRERAIKILSDFDESQARQRRSKRR